MEISKTVLLVEDNEDDIFLMRRVLKKVKIPLNLLILTDGRNAIDYLAGNGPFGDRSVHPLPSLIFLDLKLPFLDGFQVLRWIQEQTILKHIPISILTSSLEANDRNQAEALGASYIVKPPSPELIGEVLKLWLTEK